MPIKGMWVNRSPYSKFLILVGLVLLSGSLLSLLGFEITQVLFQIDLYSNPNVFEHYEDPNVVNALKFMQVVESISAFILPALIMAYVISPKPFEYLLLTKRPMWVSLLLVTLVILTSLPLINWLGAINSQIHLPASMAGVEQWIKTMEDKTAQLTKAFMNINSVWQFIVTIFMIALIPAIGEELIFRGIIQRMFGEWTKNIHLAIWLSAILFSAMHLQFYGFIPRMLMGAYFGYLLVWTGSLWVPILAHFVNNASSVIYEYLSQQHALPFDADKVGAVNTTTDLLFLVASIAALVGITKLIQAKEKQILV